MKDDIANNLWTLFQCTLNGFIACISTESVTTVGRDNYANNCRIRPERVRYDADLTRPFSDSSFLVRMICTSLKSTDRCSLCRRQYVTRSQSIFIDVVKKTRLSVAEQWHATRGCPCLRLPWVSNQCKVTAAPVDGCWQWTGAPSHCELSKNL